MEPVRSIDSLLAQRSRFRAFLVSRLGNEADADDVLQNGLLKAMRSAGEVDDAEKLTAWFYRLLRNAMIDHVRSRSANVRRDEVWMTEVGSRDEETKAGFLSSAMPHLGQSPGLSDSTPAHIGQKYLADAEGFTSASW
jgi:RNA polymerase sigma factor (sigma-70 family)